MHAETLEAAAWWARPRGATAATWIATYQRSLRSRQRDVIAGIVHELAPETLLEVGCHCGPNLVRLTQDDPALQCLGVDVNPEAIQAGREWAGALGLAARIQLTAGRFPAVTAAIADGSVDVVLSCYACAYVAPADLEAVLYEMGRLATRAVILAEPMTDEAPGLAEARGLSGYTEWRHRYGAALPWVGSLRGMTARTVPITPPVDKLASVLVLTR